jgi:hypothetical protein
MDIGPFHLGGTEFGNVYGLADDGTTMYAVAGTQVFSVNLSNASLTLLFDYGGGVLGAANGTAFVNENTTSTPLPAALPLFATGIGAMGFVGWRRKRRAQSVA